MLSELKFFQIFWKVVIHLGLQPSKLNRRGKIQAFLYLLIFLLPNLILYAIKLLEIATWDERIKGLETLPFILTNILEGINFVLKSNEIERNFHKVEQLFKEIADPGNLLNRAIKIFRIYYSLNILFIILSISGENINFWQTGETAVLTYTPAKDGTGFLIVWLLHVSFLYYTRLISFLADQILISMLIFQSFYLKVFRSFVRSRKINELMDITSTYIETKR
jgi:hypothetical protein